jgi:hypothetical protein
MRALSGVQNSTDTLERLEHAFDNIKRRLFSELHSVVRAQIFPAAGWNSNGPLQITASSTPGDDHDAEHSSGSGSSSGGDESGAAQNGREAMRPQP